jgi:ABC-2 type transport system ATP-binding protein
MKPIIVTKELKKSFPMPGGIYEAVCGVNLEVFEQEIFGFLGVNGAGKTTTLRMLTTLLPIDSGQAYVAGYDVKNEPQEVRKRIGYVSQQGGADSSATGYENLLLQGQLYGLNLAQTKKAADQLIHSFSLGKYINRFVATYSGGQRRRLDIALGMLHAPKILFLDEPTTGLDPQSRIKLWQEILALKAQGVAIFLTSHYLDEVDFLADRLAIMDQGKIVEIGTPQALKREIGRDIIAMDIQYDQQKQVIELLQKQDFVKELRIDNQQIRLVVNQGDTALPQVLRLLDSQGIPFKNISLAVSTLNDVFLQKTGHLVKEETYA